MMKARSSGSDNHTLASRGATTCAVAATPPAHVTPRVYANSSAAS